jgi:multimeric flavodoxin WrbA/protein-tyrosine-phosphatase
MLVLGLQGSPRIQGNTGALLDAFLEEARRLGATAERLDVARKKISPCLECGTCERDGFCPIDDDMQETYHLLWRADLIVVATPIFFYGPTAQLKALIDRSQTPWARRYVHRLQDPGRTWRRGFLLSLGATKGKNLFDGTVLTAKYFFDAVGAEFSGSLTFRQIEGAGEIKEHPTAFQQARQAAGKLLTPFLQREKILFVGHENACSSQMASAFARLHGGNRLEVKSAGSDPAEHVHPEMVAIMEEKGIDMAFLRPQSIDRAVSHWNPQRVVTMGFNAVCPVASREPRQEWGLDARCDQSKEGLRRLRDAIEKKVKGLL